MCIIWKYRVCVSLLVLFLVMMIGTALARSVAVRETGPGHGLDLDPGHGPDHDPAAETMIATEGEDVAGTAEVAAGVENDPRGGREMTNTVADE